MKKMLAYCVCVIAIVAVTVLILHYSNRDNDKNIDFLNSYGWIVDNNEIETEELLIPERFDEVYNNYNELQRQAGLELEKYKGQKAVRYTYLVLNYPKDCNDEVRANVICVNGKPVAGDIMTVRLNGFMHSLNYPKP